MKTDIAKKIERKIQQISFPKKRKLRCYNCGKMVEKTYYYYHGDQDDQVCEACAKKLEHGDTCYAGMNVFKTGSWGQ